MPDTGQLRQVSARIRAAVLRAADPRAAVSRSLSLQGGSLSAAGVPVQLGGRLALAAVGKAAPSMARAAMEILGDQVAQGLIVMPFGYRWDPARPCPQVEAHEAGHPVPDASGIAAAGRLMDMVSGLSEADVCILLLSGGGSALLPLPQAPLTLADKKAVTALLLASGADIGEMNVVRKHLSAIKGGRLAAAARCTLVTLALSDVVGDSLASIASGPTVPDPSRYADAEEILVRYGLWDAVPARVRELIGSGIAGQAPETPKSLPPRHHAAVIASNRTALEAAMAEAEACGYRPLLLTGSLSGEARDAGRFLALTALEARASGRPAAPPLCIMAGGETTVTLRGPGRGGRNQEIALSAALALAGARGILLTSFATDGKEGNTDAAGATASGETLEAGRRGGADPRVCLRKNDAYSFLSAAGELIVTGPTYTNVNDICFVLVSA
jgi:glycerate-2-kinase